MNIPKFRLKRTILLATGLLLAGSTAVLCHGLKSSAAGDYLLARVKRGPFRQVLRRIGVLQPVKEEHIIGHIWGTILEIAPQGKAVEKDEMLIRLDATTFEDAKAAQEANLAQIRVEFKKQQADASKVLNQAKLDAAGYDLTVELEQKRLDELKKGPQPADIINADVALENAKILLAAAQDELVSIEMLLRLGYASELEHRVKQLALKEQQLLVTQADIARRKIFVLDPVVIGQQELKVQDALKTRDAARERVTLLERNKQRDQENNTRRMERENKRLDDIIVKINKMVYHAPAAGVVIYKKLRWTNAFPAPGRDIFDGCEVLSLPDFSKMKVVLPVDEAHIAQVVPGLAAEIKPAGWNGPPYHGKVTKLAEKGVDEFESYATETKDIAGTANRQVFEVEIEIDGQAPLFRPGLRAEVAITMKTLAAVLLVPRTAIFKENGETLVGVSSPAGIERRKVKVLAENELSAAVEGVREDEQVLAMHSD